MTCLSSLNSCSIVNVGLRLEFWAQELSNDVFISIVRRRENRRPDMTNQTDGKAQPFVKHFVGNFHYSPHLCEFTTVVIWLCTLTYKPLVDVGNSITWTSHGLDFFFAASTHMFKIHQASGNVSWLTARAFLDACRWPWFKIYTEVAQYLVMTICATSRTPNTRRVRRYSDCLTWPCMAHRYPGAMCLIASWSVGLSGIHLICTNVFRD